MCVNLLSVRQLTKQGNVVTFDIDGCKIFDNSGSILATASVVNDLYRLNCRTVEGSSVDSAFSAFDTWHRRLGHICNDNLKKVEQSNADINLGKLNNLKCIVCVKAKQTRLPFKEVGSRATRLLELIHSDVMGPLTPKSHSELRYIVTFVDDFSRKLFLVPIKKEVRRVQ